MDQSTAQYTLATPLLIGQLTLSDLRCHQKLIWQIPAGLNLITGANGSGKTTLLEAVYLMAHGRSFRQARSPHLVRHGESHFMIHGQWRRFGPMHLSVSGKRGQTTLRLQGRDIQRRRDISDSFPVLVEAPQGQRVIDGAPGERRRWLDGLMMICFEHTRIHYERYLRAVMQRSRLLRHRGSSDELDGWEIQIVQHGMKIVAARRLLTDELNRLLANESALTEDPLTISVSMSDYDEQAWLTRLKSKRNDDVRVGSLRFGPHIDRIAIRFREREIRSAGSRGQQKLAAIALKMAECAFWSRYRRLIPIILLDDCLEALDRERQQRLFDRLLQSPAQILMTAPDAAEINVDRDINVHRITGSELLSGITNPLLAGNYRSGQENRMEEAV